MGYLWRSFFKIFIVLFVFSTCHASDTDNTNPKTFLVFGGKTGWIGQKLVALLQEQNQIVFCAESRLENREEIEREIVKIQPDFIINAAGVTGRPNVDWCEDNKQATIRANILGALNLADVAYLHNIHVTNFGTGCIYQYDSTHPMGSGIGFKEEDAPNFEGSIYSKTKIFLDKMLLVYPNVLNLRLRMPISSDLHPRNFITKISRYQKVVNIPNSMTVLDDLLPIAIEMTEMGVKGTYNFTNPGTISHNEILALYKQYVDPQFVWQNFTVEEQNAILKAQRSNNELDVTKLLQLFPDIPHIQDSMHNVFKKIQLGHVGN
jgi:dTDP-4-dehydrorhamnose reductase